MTTAKRALAALLDGVRWLLLGVATVATALASQIKRGTDRLRPVA